MNDWSSSIDRLINVQGTWIRQSAFDAIEPTIGGRARLHLRGGTTVDIDPPDGVPLSKFITGTATRLFQSEGNH